MTLITSPKRAFVTFAARLSIESRMFKRLHDDHIAYFGKDAPWWWCLVARVIGPMPILWHARDWPRIFQGTGPGGNHVTDAPGTD